MVTFNKFLCSLLCAAIIAVTVARCQTVSPVIDIRPDVSDILSGRFWDLTQSEDVNFDEIKDSIKVNRYSDYTPDRLTEDNFVAYYAYAGDGTTGTDFLIRKEQDGTFGVYKRSSNNGKTETYSGVCKNVPSLLDRIGEADSIILATTKEGDYYEFASLDYLDDGEVVSCTVKNVLTDV